MEGGSSLRAVAKKIENSSLEKGSNKLYGRISKQKGTHNNINSEVLYVLKSRPASSRSASLRFQRDWTPQPLRRNGIWHRTCFESILSECVFVNFISNFYLSKFPPPPPPPCYEEISICSAELWAYKLIFRKLLLFQEQFNSCIFYLKNCVETIKIVMNACR